jgi:hypothetical protein
LHGDVLVVRPGSPKDKYALGYKYDRISHFQGMGWHQAYQPWVMAWTGPQYVYYMCVRRKIAWVHYLNVVEGDYPWIAYNDKGSPEGSLNARRIRYETNLAQTMHPSLKINWNRTYANIILHEVFFHGIGNNRDYWLTSPPHDSLGNRESLLTRDIGITSGESEYIRKAQECHARSSSDISDSANDSSRQSN